MNLTATNQVLRIYLGEAMTTANCDITASYGDFGNNNFLLGANKTRSNGVTHVTVVAAPAINYQRQVKEVRLFNNDTVPHNVTLELFDGSNTWIVGTTATAGAVPVGGSFVYTPEAGVCCTGGGGGGSSLTVEDDTGHTVASVGTLQVLGVVVSGSTPSAITNMTTITGADGTGTTSGVGISIAGGVGNPAGPSGYGGGVTLSGGAGGANPTLSTGGSAYLYGGAAGDAVTYSAGGNIIFRGGFSGTLSTVDGLGGSAYFTGGRGGTAASNGRGGNVRFSGGTSYGTADGGGVYLHGGTAAGTGKGGEVTLLTGTALGAMPGGPLNMYLGPGTPPGQMKVNNDASLIVTSHSWFAGEPLDGRTIFTATRAMLVTAVIGRVDVANGGAATLLIVKAASGTAPGAGTALTSTTMDLAGTADTNQTLTLSVTPADLLMAPGDSLCMSETGALGTSVGCITVWATPQ